MSAEILREAASLMRERAEAATPGHVAMPIRKPIKILGVCDGCAQPASLVADYDDGWLCFECDSAAAFEGAWHPAVALAVADWLEHEARLLDEIAKAHARPMPKARLDNALAVARAYLGSQS